MIVILKAAVSVLMFFLVFSGMSLTGNMLLRNGSDAALYAAVVVSIIQFVMLFVAARELINFFKGAKHGQ